MAQPASHVRSCLAFACAFVAASSNAAPSLINTSSCKHLVLEGGSMTCTNELCTLEDQAMLTCDGLRLWADEIELATTPEGDFAGAVARGNVMLVDGNRLVTCEHLALDADRIRARMSEVEVKVKAGREVMPVSGVPLGRDSVVLRGQNVERTTERRLRIDNADFTLCDCGEAKPSWRISGESIDVELDDRVTIFWPVFWISPFGLDVMVPLTPPLLPLSLPLTPRAMGFLPPAITFRRLVWPTVDLPFFVPIGDSWDITLTPGLRTDWSPDHELASPRTYGAPRLGGRLRYAPSKKTQGTWSLEWTHDGQNGAAIAAEHPTTSPYWQLKDRVAVSADHRTDFSDSLRLLLRGRFLSDDRYLDDFGIALSDRAAVYIPSRLQLQLRTTRMTASASADYLQRIGNTRDDYRNLQREEALGPQHGPGVAWQLMPTAIGAGLHLGADASFDRYGPWREASPSESPTLFVTRAAPNLAFAKDAGPLRLRAKGTLDAAWLSGTGGVGEPRQNLAAITEANSWLHLARDFGAIRHVITPRIDYLGMPWRSGPALDEIAFRRLVIDDPAEDPVELSQQRAAALAAMTKVSQLDARLRRDQTSQQLSLALGQALFDTKKRTAAPFATLELRQPFDLTRAELLASQLEIRLVSPRAGSLGAQTSIYFPGLAHEQTDSLTLDQNRALRELLVWASSPPIGPLSLRASYNRYTPESGRLLHSIYELAAPLDRTVPGASWVEYIDGRVTLRLRRYFSASYATSYCFLPPGQERTETLPGFSGHSLGIDYQSPCECWGMKIFGSKAAGQPWRELQAGIVFSIGGYSVGSAR